MNFKKIAAYSVALIVIVLGWVFNQDKKQTSTAETYIAAENTNENTQEDLIRNAEYIRYSKHARCRMDCRDINESEVEKILKTGSINYRKSELDAKVCEQRYAVEGYGNDRQHIRVIVAPCKNEITVITCIDIEKDWECACS